MKKSRVTAILVGVLALTIAVAGVSFAWFASRTGSIGGKGNAAYLRLLGDHKSLHLEFYSVLPGQAVTFKDGQKLEYEADRGGIIEVGIDIFDIDPSDPENAAYRVYLDEDLAKKHETDIDLRVTAGDYVKEAPYKYYFTRDRLKEIMEVQILGSSAGNINGKTIKAIYSEDGAKNVTFKFNAGNKKAYLYIPEAAQGLEPKQFQTIKAKLIEAAPGDPAIISVHFLGEFGGNYAKTPGGALSMDRPWEQEAVFEGVGAGLNIKAVQATKEAVVDYMSSAAATFVGSVAGFNLDAVGGPASWKYVG